jgi:uncharacterized protein YegJ (DUF2314 family)
MRAVRALPLLAALAFLPACSSTKEPPPGAQVVAPPDAGPDAAVVRHLGRVLSQQANLTLGLYFTPKPKIDPKEALARSCAVQARAFARVDSIPALLRAPGFAMMPRRNPSDDALEPQFIAFAGIELSAAQIEALPHSDPGATITLVGPVTERWRLVRAADELLDCLAEATGGVVFDGDTRQLFTLDAFRRRRLAGWKDGRSSLSSQYVTHIYPDGDYLRLVTLGLDRFGLPDLVLNQSLRTEASRAEALIRLVAMALEQPGVSVDDGFLDLDLDAPWARGLLTSGGLGADAQRKARIGLVEGTRDAGDSQNRLWELRFDDFPGATPQERQSAAFTRLFGAAYDKLMLANHQGGELAAASQRARAQLPKIKKRFAAGLEPGERFLVKAPFEVGGENGGHEYMWIEVVSWNAGVLAGALGNEPDHIPTLHKGASVKVAEKDVYDWIIVHEDGTEEGNETTRVLEQQERGGK